MSNFKVSDEAWYFYLNQESLACTVNPDEIILTGTHVFSVHPAGWINMENGESVVKEDAFHSQQEAIDAMIKRLEQMKEEIE